MNRSPQTRSGIVLLVVLGMLSLFTVLVVSFVVFSSQMGQIAASNEERTRTEIPLQTPIDGVMRQVVSGTNDYKSALFGHSLMEDLYGTDGLQLRVGHQRQRGPAYANRPILPPRDGVTGIHRFGGMLLLPLQANGEPNTTLFKFPTNFVPWFDDGDTTINDGDAVEIEPPPGNNTLSRVDLDFFHVTHRPDLDDSFSGRLVTFDEGPLAGVTFRVIRSFGRQNGEPVDGAGNRYSTPPTTASGSTYPPPAPIGMNPAYNNAVAYQLDEYTLAGCLVIDLSEFPTEEIAINGSIQQLYQLAATFPNALLYSPGPDGLPGRAFFDDNGNGTADDLDELGAVGTDDYGYRFTMNGVPFNGRGMNPSGLTGIGRNGAIVDAFADMELQINAALMGPTIIAGNGASTGLFAEPDEQWDAAGLENIWLAYLPSDHRRASNAIAGPLYNGFGSQDLNRQRGLDVIPSFHRPAIINYLLNAPVRLPGDSMDPTDSNVPPAQPYFERTLADMVASPSFVAPFNDHLRLQALINRIRRATLRPLNFSHASFNADMDGDGIPFDGAPGFSGSNPAPIMSETIDLTQNITTVAGFRNVADQIRRLGAWLISGPWDVDNDGDGLPDSVWVNLELPETVAPDGTVIKPMAAILIEDLDGKINVNYAGSMAQVVESRFTDGPNNAGDRRYFNRTEYFAAQGSLSSFGFGGGIGPAEIDFSHLFVEPSVPPGFNGPLTTNQVGVPLAFGGTLLRTRYGNLLNVRQGGGIYDYINPYPGANRTRFPGVGSLADPADILYSRDLLSRIPLASREIPPVPPASPALPPAQGPFPRRPQDMHGVSRTNKDVHGEHIFSVPTTNRYLMGDVVNQVYESGATEIRGDDQPFTPVEYVDFLRDGELGGRLAQLLTDAAIRNPSLKNLLTTESRSLDSPEVPGEVSLMHLLAEKLNAASVPLVAQQTHLDRMLSHELRKGSKLNLNRDLGDGWDQDGDNLFGDGDESDQRLIPPNAATPNQPNNRVSGSTGASKFAFPQIQFTHPTEGSVQANYAPITFSQNDFDGIDIDGDGTLDSGTLFDTNNDATPDARVKAPDGAELLARHLYVLMFTLIHDPNGAGELVPNFPYPSPANFTTDVATRNRYVARRLAQWAVNAVDYRDYNAARTRLRFDPNPFNGWNPNVAVRNTVWGMERPELEITEAMAFHNKRVKRNLMPQRVNLGLAADGEDAGDEDGDPMAGIQDNPDSDMDQFRIPQATAIIELHNLRSRRIGVGVGQPSLPRELYVATPGGYELALGRTVGAGLQESPIWRIAVGAPTGGDLYKSPRWLYDAQRVGGELVGNQSRNEELGHLQVNSPVTNWNDSMQVNTDITDEINDVWDETQRHGLGVIHVTPYHTGAPVVNPNQERVRLADGTFGTTNDTGVAGDHEIRLERFLWFAPLRPTARDNTANMLRILSDPRSGMRPDNVYYNRLDRYAPGDTNLAINVSPNIQLGGYAVIAPRQTTVLGQTNVSQPGNGFERHLVRQQFRFIRQGGTGPFRLDYFDLANRTDAMTPRYAEDAPGAYHINGVVPIICESLAPHETVETIPAADVNRLAWQNYFGDINNQNRTVDMGFNISAPLPNESYYEAPTHFIWNDSMTNLGMETPQEYPLIDGYAQYHDTVAGAHPDIPFDHLPGAPLNANSYDTLDSGNATVTVSWAAVGTHQDARTIFLQRLADPSRPWHPIDNPYLTEDIIPIDLTTFNGEGDVREEVDRDGDGNPANDSYWADQARTLFDGANFVPEIKMDSRRKIPDALKDRAITALLPNGGGSGDLSDFDRVTITKRTALSASFSVLRDSIPDGAWGAYWPFEIGSYWDDASGNRPNLVADPDPAPPVPPAPPEINDPFDTRYDPNLTFDRIGDRFTQTFGYVNREYGFPVRSDSVRVASFGVGEPDKVSWNMLTWMDRGFQSPMELLNVPATSRTGLLASFTPGTVIDGGSADREIPTNIGHLLKFTDGYAAHRPEDQQWDTTGSNRPVTERLPLGSTQDTEDADFDDDMTAFTGERAGFEQIFDYVDVGPVWFDSQRWIDPLKVVARPDSFLNTQSAGYQLQGRLFNQAVTTLQPPYNYIGKHRTPGKINVNTTPDYIRKGTQFVATNPLDVPHVLFDEGESPDTPGTSPVANGLVINPVQSNPTNNNINSDGLSTQFLNTARLYGNGSVYRALSWGISTPYELDATFGSPSVMGENNEYEASVDSQFGYGFKAFIESRRGYAGTNRGSRNIPAYAAFSNYQHPDLDWRYPTRFAGVFAPARSAALGSVQRFMRTEDNNQHSVLPAGADPHVIGSLRRTHDMGIWRPHPDFNSRLVTAAQRAAHGTAGDPTFTLAVEADPTGDVQNDGSEGLGAASGDTIMPALSNSKPSVTGLKMSMLNNGLFERSQAELHKDFRSLDRDSYFRFHGASRLAGVTTNHSNVFLIRMTTSYFVVDPRTGAVGAEYVDSTGEPVRARATFVVDRSIPVGFLRGKEMNSQNTYLYAEIEE